MLFRATEEQFSYAALREDNTEEKFSVPKENLVYLLCNS